LNPTEDKKIVEEIKGDAPKALKFKPPSKKKQGMEEKQPWTEVLPKPKKVLNGKKSKVTPPKQFHDEGDQVVRVARYGRVEAYGNYC